MRKLQLAILVTALIGASSASASLVAMGDPTITGSWAQGWSYSDGNFDAITGTMITGLFDYTASPNPLAIDTTYPSWSVGIVSPNFGSINGITTPFVTFTTHFNGAVTTPLSWLFQAYDQNNVVAQLVVSWTGGAHGEWDISPVPEPTTIIAGALLLLPFGASAVRILRKRQTA